MTRLTLQTRLQSQMIDITAQVRDAVRAAGLSDGAVMVFVPHTTAAVTINEDADPDVKSDMIAKLEKLIPRRESYYQHAEGNSDSHVKTALVGNSALIPVEKGELVLGQWQGVYFCEFDGPRTRSVVVTVLRG